MITKILQFLDQTGVYLLCMCIPGILFTLGGIRIIKTKRILSIGRDSHFRWKEPVLLKGKDAMGPGSCILVFGIGLVLFGIISIIGILQ